VFLRAAEIQPASRRTCISSLHRHRAMETPSASAHRALVYSPLLDGGFRLK
jgi:hypothetical protein